MAAIAASNEHMHPTIAPRRVMNPFENVWAPPKWHVLVQLLVGVTLFPIRVLVIIVAFVLIIWPTTLLASCLLPSEKTGEARVEPAGHALRIAMYPTRCALFLLRAAATTEPAWR
jgi:hypothetical protein